MTPGVRQGSQCHPCGIVIRSSVWRLLCNREILSIFNKLNSMLPVFNGLVVVVSYKLLSLSCCEARPTCSNVNLVTGQRPTERASRPKYSEYKKKVSRSNYPVKYHIPRKWKVDTFRKQK